MLLDELRQDFFFQFLDYPFCAPGDQSMFTCLLKDNHIMGWEKAFLGVANDSLERGDIF